MSHGVCGSVWANKHMTEIRCYERQKVANGFVLLTWTTQSWHSRHQLQQLHDRLSDEGLTNADYCRCFQRRKSRISLSMSLRKEVWRTARPVRNARSLRLSGSWRAFGTGASSSSIGITGMLRFSAAAIPGRDFPCAAISNRRRSSSSVHGRRSLRIGEKARDGQRVPATRSVVDAATSVQF